MIDFEPLNQAWPRAECTFSTKAEAGTLRVAKIETSFETSMGASLEKVAFASKERMMIDCRSGGRAHCISSTAETSSVGRRCAHAVGMRKSSSRFRVTTSGILDWG